MIAIEEINLQEKALTIQISTTNPTAICPLCEQSSPKIQSRYQRTLADLNWAEYSVRLIGQVRRFFCLNAACKRKIFCERLNPLTPAYARRTLRFTNWLREVAFAQGGRPGVRLIAKQGLTISRHTLIRLIRNTPLPHFQTPRLLGVDDWSFRKGHSYGTLLVDLEKHCPIELLAERSSQIFGDWLKTHSGIEVISRDRSSSYAEAARLHSPEAIQVADRFHLWQNLRTTIEQFFIRTQVWKQSFFVTDPDSLMAKISPEHKAVVVAQEQAQPKPKKLITRRSAQVVKEPTKKEKVQQNRYLRRLVYYQQVVGMYQAGMTNLEIAAKLKMNRKTVARYLKAGSMEVVKTKPRQPGPSKVDLYKGYLEKRWIEEQPTIEQLHQEITAQGYTGSIGPIRKYLADFRPYPGWGGGWYKHQSRPRLLSHQLPTSSPNKSHKLSARQASWLMFKGARGDELKKEDPQLLPQLVERNEEVKSFYEVLRGFAKMLKAKDGKGLEEWLVQAQASQVLEAVSFARGIEIDKAAVLAGLNLPYSNGQLEGQVNRLKNIKRNMYGRANFDLLRARVLRAA